MRISPANDVIPVELFVVERQDIDDIIEHAEKTMRRLNVVRRVGGVAAS